MGSHAQYMEKWASFFQALLPFTFIVVDFLVVALSAIRFRVISLLV